MALRLFDRISLLLRADAHGIVEALEERSLLLKQALRDAELELETKRARLAALAQEEARLAERAARCGGALAALDADVELALAGEREELARFAIRRLLPLRRERAALDRERAERAAERTALAARLGEQEAAFEELRVRVQARLAQEADATGDLRSPPPVDEAEVELELLRRRGATPAQARGAGAETPR